MATEREEEVAVKVAVAKAVVAEAVAVEVARGADEGVVKIGQVERVPPHAAVAVGADRANGKTQTSRVKAKRRVIRPPKTVAAVVIVAAEKLARRAAAKAEFCSQFRQILGQALGPRAVAADYRDKRRAIQLSQLPKTFGLMALEGIRSALPLSRYSNALTPLTHCNFAGQRSQHVIHHMVLDHFFAGAIQTGQ